MELERLGWRSGRHIERHHDLYRIARVDVANVSVEPQIHG